MEVSRCLIFVVADRDDQALELCTWLRRQPLHEESFIVAVGVCDRIERLRAYHAAGIDDDIAAPSDPRVWLEREAIYLRYARAKWARLDDEEDRWASLLDHLPCLVCAQTDDGLIRAWNHECERVTGFSDSEIIGNPQALEMLCPDRDYREAKRAEWQSRGGATGTWEWSFRRSDGDTRTIAWTLHLPRPWSRRWGVWGLGIDVTEARRAQDILLASEQRLRSMAATLAVAEERERRQIAVQLHDAIGQLLFAARIKIGTLSNAAPPEQRKLFDEVAGHIQSAITESRSLTMQLSPPALYELGLEAALHWLTEHFQQVHGLKCRFRTNIPGRKYPHETAVVLFQAARELMFNVVKHARAHGCRLWLGEEADCLIVSVEDDGVGFSQTGAGGEKEAGVGLFHLQERLKLISGVLTIDPGFKKGTRVQVRIPKAGQIVSNCEIHR